MIKSTHFLNQLSNWVWSYPLLLLLVGTGLLYSVLLRGLQFRYLFYSIKLIFSRHDETAPGDVSQFQSLMTAMSATIGIGSITGVATAVAAGGLGAIFWMWIVGFLGMATKYAEAILGIKYRTLDANGQMRGGPMYYLEKGLGWKGLALLFALAGSIAALTTGNMVQSNSVAVAFTHYVSIDRIWIGMVLSLLTGIVLLKGIKSIAWVTEYLVPLMASIYIIGGLVVICINYRLIPQGIYQIIHAAFNKQAAFGGFLGSSILFAMRMGIARGIFSNEAGLGSSPIASAAARTDHPGTQAMISMSGAFIATFIVCTITGLVIAVTGVLGQFSANGIALNGSSMVIHGFNHSLPGSGWLVTIALMMFGYTTILGWAYYGEKCFEYLFGSHSIFFYRALYTTVVALGAVLGLDFIWSVSDISNALMCIPNLLGLIGLAFVVKQESDSFIKGIKPSKVRT
ncbi:MAG: Amino-acid carrier protein AlsT [Chlamydiae bacterium]|nr:Amino-acid carrier protein AlsT [Chlamydiota bacterium]